MSNSVISEEIYIPPQLYENHAKVHNIEDHEAVVVEDEIKLNASRGILVALIICIPIWILIIAGIVWWPWW